MCIRDRSRPACGTTNASGRESRLGPVLFSEPSKSRSRSASSSARRPGYHEPENGVACKEAMRSITLFLDRREVLARSPRAGTPKARNRRLAIRAGAVCRQSILEDFEAGPLHQQSSTIRAVRVFEFADAAREVPRINVCLLYTSSPRRCTSRAIWRAHGSFRSGRWRNAVVCWARNIRTRWP